LKIQDTSYTTTPMELYPNFVLKLFFQIIILENSMFSKNIK